MGSIDIGDIVGLGFDVIGADLPFIQKPNESWDCYLLIGGTWLFAGRVVKQDLDPTGHLGTPFQGVAVGVGAAPYSFLRPTGKTQPTDAAYRLNATGQPQQSPIDPGRNEDSGANVQSFDAWALSGTPAAFVYLGRGPLADLDLGGLGGRLEPLDQPIVIRPTGILPGQPGYRFDAQGKSV